MVVLIRFSHLIIYICWEANVQNCLIFLTFKQSYSEDVTYANIKSVQLKQVDRSRLTAAQIHLLCDLEYVTEMSEADALVFISVSLTINIFKKLNFVAF